MTTATGCPRCGGPMDGARQVTALRSDGIPVSRMECLTCWAAQVTRKPQKGPYRAAMADGAMVPAAQRPGPSGASTEAFGDLPLFAEVHQ